MINKAFDCIVVGTGAAGYNAAIRLAEGGVRTAIVTEGVNCGTSRNTGSDKQTYYKLGLGGDAPDSVRRMARELFECGCVDGDTALCEAALSPRCFFALCELGVDFPVNRYGEYVGYKTDHDPFARATSAGPLTSKFMTEALQRRAGELNIPILDRLLAVEILKDPSGVCGLVCVSPDSAESVAFGCGNLVLATGGPAGVYSDSVYPECHTGASSLAINAGASLQNLTEWQYGLASLSPRWNVSGTYMQALPRFISTDESGGDEREFLFDFFGDAYSALSAAFLKGYQWPFDSRKILSGSSVVDLLVYRERVLKGRRVWLDYTKNPFGLENIDFSLLSPEARDYLGRAGACFGTPIDRLCLMNLPAVELYRGKGVDLSREPLEIALCAQHCNGGVAVDLWWQSGVPGLFAAGECAGTHGITRPGGSALNAGQAGSLRAAQFIRAHPRPLSAGFDQTAAAALSRHDAFIGKMLANGGNSGDMLERARKRMSGCGAAIRDKAAAARLCRELADELGEFESRFGVASRRDISSAYKLRDALTVQLALLTAILDFSKKTGSSRGSALYYNKNGVLRSGLDELFRFLPDDGCTRGLIQEVFLEDGAFKTRWRDVRPFPEGGDFFENVWRQYRENRNVF